MFKKLFNKKIITATLGLFSFFVFASSAFAQTPISACTTISAGGEYVLTDNIGSGGDCITIDPGLSNVTIDGAGFTINGNVLGLDGVNSDEFLISATNIVLEDVIVTGTIQSGTGGSGDPSGSGGSITIINSTTTAVTAGAGGGGLSNGSNGGSIIILTSSVGTLVSGTGYQSVGSINIATSTFGNIVANAFSQNVPSGIITISGDNIDLSNKTISATGGNQEGTLTVTYNTINTTGTVLSSLSNITINGTSYGPYPGGSWPVYLTPGNISECGVFTLPGVYTLTNNIAGNCIIGIDGVTIDGGDNGSGGHYSILGNVSAVAGEATSTLTLSYINVLGEISSTGLLGDISLINASTSNISSDGKVTVDYGSQTGNILAGSDVTVQNNSITGYISITSASSGGSGGSSGGSSSGTIGVILVDNSTTGDLAVVAGSSGSGGGSGGSGGTITVQNNSNTGIVTSLGGKIIITDSETLAITSGGGDVEVTDSDVGEINSGSGNIKILHSIFGGIYNYNDNSGDYSFSIPIISITNSTTTNSIIGLNDMAFELNILSSSVGNIDLKSDSGGGSFSKVYILNSTTGNNITVGNGGNDPTIIISSDGILNLANKNISVLGTGGTLSNGTGILELNYTGLITNASTTFSALSDLILNGESQGPFAGGVYNPTIYYFKSIDTVGTPDEGDWNVLDNWWTDPNFTIQATSLPTSLDQVFVHSDLLKNTGSEIATAGTITFLGTSKNHIEINVVLAIFDEQSENAADGIINGNATFKEDESNNLGTVRGQIMENYETLNTLDDEQRNWGGIVISENGTKIAAYEISTGGSVTGYVYTSDNSGDTWTRQDDLSNRRWNSITMSDNGNKIALTSSAYGLYIYTGVNDGSSWSWTEQTDLGQKAWSSITSSGDGINIMASVHDSVMGYGDYVYITNDGGSSWATSSSTFNMGSVVSSEGGQKLAAVAVDGGISSIYVSNDGGFEWDEKIDTQRLHYPGSLEFMWNNIDIDNSGDKIIATETNYGSHGYGYVYISNDGGDSWNQETDLGTKSWTDVSISSNGQKIVLVPHAPNVESYGKVFVSDDGGDNWSEKIILPGQRIDKVEISGNGEKYAVLAAGKVYVLEVARGESILTRLYTQSVSTIRKFAGEFAEGARDTWVIISKGVDTIVNLTGAVYDLLTNTFKSLLGGLFIQNPTNILETEIGESWSLVADNLTSNVTIGSITTSFDGEEVSFSAYGYVYTSLDGGGSWQTKQFPHGSSQIGSRFNSSVKFTPDGEKLVYSYSRHFYVSNDSGDTWSEEKDIADVPVFSRSLTISSNGQKMNIKLTIHETSEKIPSMSHIYKTTDGGNNWIRQENEDFSDEEAEKNFSWIASSDDGTKSVATVYGGYIYTNNEGDDWIARTDLGQLNWGPVAMSANGQKIVLDTFTQGDGNIYISTTTGDSWTTIDAGIVDLDDIAMSADGQKIVALYGRAAPVKIYTSLDGGDTWDEIDSPVDEAVVDIDLSGDGNTLYLVTQNNDVYKTQALSEIGRPVVPAITINSPIDKNDGDVIKWEPDIEWGSTATKCEYKMDIGVYKTTTCSLGGSDIPRPTGGQHTLYLKATDILGNTAEKSVTFNYDNTAPIDTDCSVPLDESERQYYYLKDGAVTNDCYLGANVELWGAQSGPGVLTGNIISNSTSSKAYNLTLRNITVTGTINTSGISSGAAGGDVYVYNSTTTSINTSGANHTNGNGGKAGNVTVDTAVTGSVTSNGGDGKINGGNGGNISISNADATSPNTAVTSNGGSSTLCGVPGSSGNINIQNADGYVAAGSPGTVAEYCFVQRSPSSGTKMVVTREEFRQNNTVTNPVTPPSNGGGNNSTGGSTAPTVIPSFSFFGPGGGVGTFTPQNFGTTVIPWPFKDFKPVTQLVFTPTPNFDLNISRFLFAPLPSSIADAISRMPQIASALSSSNINKEQDLAALSFRPIPLQNEENPDRGQFIVKSGDTQIQSYVAYDLSMKTIAQLVKVSASQSLSISLIPLSEGEVTATYLDQVLTFTNQAGDTYTANITTPFSPGRYVLESDSSPIPLVVEVVNSGEAHSQIDNRPWWQVIIDFIWNWFN